MATPAEGRSLAPDLVLASASPRRRELLERVGLRVRVDPVGIDETPRAGERAVEVPRRLAAEKATAAALHLASELPLPILAADTVVVADGVLLGKPADATEAATMLRRLAGRRHEVVTATCVRAGVEHDLRRAVSTQVTFRLLEDSEIAAYVSSGEWRGKAGGYALQGIAAAFVTELRGSHTNVIGLPLAEVLADLRAVGAVPGWPPAGFGHPAGDAP